MGATTFADLQNDPAYVSLRKTVATRSSPLLAFVGSGLSSGLPSWGGLKAHLVDILRRKAAGLDPTAARGLAERADDIERNRNYWASFSALEAALGTTTYRSEIRSELEGGFTADPPQAYETLWRTPIQGLLTPNLDSFARRSFSEVHGSRELKAFTGREAARLALVLHGPHKFVFNLHGTVDDADSWVFTDKELKSLFNDHRYEEMLRRVFTGFTVLFLGIGADDVAVGGPLEALSRSRVQGQTHYWITDRDGASTDAWAEQAGIRVVRYSAPGGSHVLLGEVLKDLATASVPDVVAPPVVRTRATDPLSATTILTPPDELITHRLDVIRNVLNDRAADLLKQDNGQALFEAFVSEYDEVIHRAWYTSALTGKNKLFEYTLEEEVAKGAFGRVFRATDPRGEVVAVKVLLTEIRTDLQLLQSFRRGVQAMRILDERNVSGMVTYRDATEIPAFVVMDWIEGPNLAYAKELRMLDDWDDILWAALELAKALKRAHDLPERVLHRDVRPANVMLSGGWSSAQQDWELVVLDFDLSTFRGARQKSVLAEASALGYLAPEQLDSAVGGSTRSAAVDSFGFGMTLYFLCSGAEPDAYMQRQLAYLSAVRRATTEVSGASWHSLPRRIERLILGATEDAQSRRWDMAQIIRELERLWKAHRVPEELGYNDMLCEEIAARCPAMTAYDWDIDTETARMANPSGLTVWLRGPVATDSMQLTVAWSATGMEDRASIAKYLPERLQRAAAVLRTGRWEKVTPKQEKQSAVLTASLSRRAAKATLASSAEALNKALESLQFDRHVT